VITLKQRLSIRGEFDGTVQLYRHEHVAGLVGQGDR